MEDIKLKAEKQVTDNIVKPTPAVGDTNKTELTEKNLKTKTSTGSSAEQDLDTFLLGDLEDSDGGAGIYFLNTIVITNSWLEYHIYLPSDRNRFFFFF